MECCKWEELGLLYSANELDGNNTRDFEEHLKECEECRKELYYYREEKKRFYTQTVLGDAPSANVDAEILRVCSNLRKKATTFTLMPSFLRKAIVPVALFAVAFISIGYVMLNMENARQLKAASLNGNTRVATQQSSVAALPSAAVNIGRDSATDSARTPKMNYANSRGNLEGQGVIPVDLKNK
jgi:anti-sigma factor RsiW